MLKIFACSIVLINSLIAGIYFPLQKGNHWGYSSGTHPVCDGNLVICAIEKDTTIGSFTYAYFPFGSAFNEKIVRADSNKVYSFDPVSHSEHVVFDFNAKPGDTVSNFNGSQRIIIALGSLQFIEAGTQFTNTVYTIKDSLGVYSFNFMGCPYSLTNAFINGKTVYPTFVHQSTNTLIPNQIVLTPNFPNPFNSSTSIRFYNPYEQEVRIDVLNTVGQQLYTLIHSVKLEGWHQLSWDASKYSSGTYFFRLQTNFSTQYQVATLVK